ncbi:T9SS type B sorting domain-containing protein [Psychroserpens sp. Hel_I_66]|uniref:T9SS type B sorting domain-containing protein n=1 Tax=Psychroserpens sp. Hel_I_66 TaxID=1250004 RepID=UPI000648204D|nr:T9SS type B sorting domain-containing protein [Psychroserpens sp. Hel_I_66]
MRSRWLLVLLLIFSFSENSIAQNSPPTIVAEGNQEFCGSSPMNVVTSVSITDPDAGDISLDNVFLQISEGYVSTEDLLVLTGTHPNITSTWNVPEGKLELQGPASFTEFENAISDVLYQTTQSNFTQDKSFSINLGDANFLPSTGHYYVYVSSPGITWTTARTQAENTFYFGIQGYLVTITSEEESQFAGEQSPGLGWIGANDAETEGTWKWVTGPENGQTFWIGEVTGSAPGGEYSNWNTGEPNNIGGNEDYAHITDPSVGNIGSWNDLPNAGDGSPSDPYYPKGYLVEFGGMPGDPEINLSASTTIITPKLSLEASVGCSDGISTLNVNSNTPTVLWYETPSSTTVLNSEPTYEVQLDADTTFWILPLFDGCNGGIRIPFAVDVLESPEAIDLNIVQCDDEINDGFTDFSLSLYFEEITNGITANRAVVFYEDINLTSEISGDLFTNTSNPQTVYAEVVDTSSGCTSISEVIISVNSNVINPVNLEACDTPAQTGIVPFDLSLASEEILESVPADSTIEFYETYEDAGLEMNSLPISFTNTVPYSQTIYARVETQDGSCFAITQVELTVNSVPNILSEETVLYCLNDFPQTITLSGGVMGDIPNNYYYYWSTGETTIDIEVNEIGTYTVEVAFVDGCSKIKTIEVLPSNVATIENIIVEDLSNNNSITILVSGEGEYQYALNNSEGIYQNSNTFNNVTAGIYTVYVKDVKNDCGIVSEDVSVIGYSKFFTPNGDTFNDTWQLKGISEQFQPNTEVYIFDRFGKLLYTLNSPFDAWDGTFNGKPLPTSDYWFSATLEDGRTFTNHFTLKR